MSEMQAMQMSLTIRVVEMFGGLSIVVGADLGLNLREEFEFGLLEVCFVVIVLVDVSTLEVILDWPRLKLLFGLLCVTEGRC